MLILLLLLQVSAIQGMERLRLQGGDGPCSGRVEVFHENEWGIVCNHKWQKANENVICRSLDCGVPKASSTYHTIPATLGKAWMNEVNYKILPSLEYTCAGAVQLHGGSEIYTVCDRNWGEKEKKVLCRELNCDTAQSKLLPTTFQSQGRQISSINCAGDEKFLWQCDKLIEEGQCSDPVVVVCSEQKMVYILEDSPCSGRVRVEAEGESFWLAGSQEQNDNANVIYAWTEEHSQQLCEDLGCGKALTPDRSKTSPGVQFSDMYCPKKVSNLTQCNFIPKSDESYCNKNPVYVVCSDSVQARLSDPRVRCGGSVELLYSGEWRPVCKNQVRMLLQGSSACKGMVFALGTSAELRPVSLEHWGENELQVLCRYLKCGKSKSFQGIQTALVNWWTERYTCQGNETSIWSCHRHTNTKPTKKEQLYIECSEYYSPMPVTMIVTISLAAILVLAVALIIVLRIRKVRRLKKGKMGFDSGDYEDVLPEENETPESTKKAAQSRVGVENELGSWASASEYDDIDEGSDHLLRVETEAPEQDQTQRNGADGVKEDLQDDYDDVMEPVEPLEEDEASQLLQPYENFPEKDEDVKDEGIQLQPDQPGVHGPHPVLIYIVGKLLVEVIGGGAALPGEEPCEDAENDHAKGPGVQAGLHTEWVHPRSTLPILSNHRTQLRGHV
ncbi:hypothetical protein JZ751_014813, partial [Albula glossodonta]